MDTWGPSNEEFRSGTRTTTGTLITIPAGKRYTGDLVLSASVAVLGNSTPTVTISGTNAGPASGTVIGRINLVGLALTTVADSVCLPVICRAPVENDVTLEFTAGANGVSSATINGFIYE